LTAQNSILKKGRRQLQWEAFALITMQAIDEDSKAKEREEKFKRWLQDKTLRDKALEYLRKLDKCRAEGEDSLKEVAVCLLAVDRLMGHDDIGGDDDVDENVDINAVKVSQRLQRFSQRSEGYQSMLLHQYAANPKHASPQNGMRACDFNALRRLLF